MMEVKFQYDIVDSSYGPRVEILATSGERVAILLSERVNYEYKYGVEEAAWRIVTSALSRAITQEYDYES